MTSNGNENMDQEKYGMIIPPNNLKKKVKITIVEDGKETEAIEAAEEAMAGMSDKFREWMLEEAANLDQARKEAQKDRNDDTINTLYVVGHDVKGQAETMGYPLITLIATSLCKLIEIWENPKTFPLDQLNNHVDAIKVIINEDIKTKDHPMGKKLAESLITVVYDYADELAAKKAKTGAEA